MNATTVIHVRDMQAGDIYIGRAVPRKGLPCSPYANPYRIGEYDPETGQPMDRSGVIRWFRAWVTHNRQEQAAWIREHVHELHGKRLACWCHPEDCHGNVLAELADQAVALHRVLAYCSRQHRLPDAGLAIGQSTERVCHHCGERLRFSVVADWPRRYKIIREVVTKA